VLRPPPTLPQCEEVRHIAAALVWVLAAAAAVEAAVVAAEGLMATTAELGSLREVAAVEVGAWAVVHCTRILTNHLHKMTQR